MTNNNDNTKSTTTSNTQTKTGIIGKSDFPSEAEKSTSKRTVTYRGKLDTAVTSKVLFTGDSGKPNFSSEQKDVQKSAGRDMIADLIKAAADPTVSTYIIPAGNYGFNMNITAPNGVPSGIIIKDIERSADNPFIIKADGVTFWFESTGEACPSVSRGLQFINCSHIYLDGITLDGYSANTIEGEIVNIDKSGNRIGIKPYIGTMSLNPSVLNYAMGSSEFRILPVKSNGDLMSALYNINNQWGPASLWGKKLELDDNGICWFTFNTTTLMDTVFEDSWTNFYGDNGTPKIGDQLSILYGVVIAICLDNCKQMRVTGLNSYIAKGGFWENGGYGDHLWKDCYFGPRPNTNRLLGGDCNMAQGLRHGSTYDGLVYGLTSDDAINIHGFWSEANSVSKLPDGGYNVNFEYAPVGIKAGDPVMFYTKSGALVATCTVKSDPYEHFNYNGFLDSSIILNEEPPENYSSFIARWPNSECDGFVIRNCRFVNNYQRILINSGSGTVENNLIINNGSNLALTSSTLIYEGGIMNNITVKDNVFYNTANHPGAKAVDIYQTDDWDEYISAENITIMNNIFVNCGKMLFAVNSKNMSINGNLIINPMIYGGTVTSFEDVATIKNNCSTSSCSDNKVYLTSGNASDGSNPVEITTASKLAEAIDVCRNSNLSPHSTASKLRSLFN